VPDVRVRARRHDGHGCLSRHQLTPYAPRSSTSSLNYCDIVETETKAGLAYRQSSYSPRATLAPSFTCAPQ
jgi:hypothetical protein